MLNIQNAQFLISAASDKQWPADNLPEFCFLGRSNVGKSSLINYLVNRRSLAKTSQNPGKTILINFFAINSDQFRFVDVPGYGYAKRSKIQRQNFIVMISHYLATRANCQLIFLLVDFRHEPSVDDIAMVEFLKTIKRPFMIIATKIDKVSRNDYFKQKKLVTKTLKLVSQEQIILFSSSKKIGRDDVLSIVSNYVQQKGQENET